MHILHVIDSLAPGGAERMLVDLANTTFADGHQVSVCITRSRDDLADQLATGIPIHILHRQQRFAIAPLRRLGRLVRDQGVDLLHAHSRSTLSLLAFARITCLLDKRVPIVMHDHYGVNNKKPLWLRIYGWNHVCMYVGVNPQLVSWATELGMPANRSTCIHNAMALARLEQPAVDVNLTFGLSQNVPTGIMVGSLRAVKGTDLLIEALARQTLPFQFLIVGPDAEPEFAENCRTRADALNLSDRIRFVGARDDVPALMAGCDFIVIPSRSESGPLVLIEGMMAGLPFVCTRVGGIAHQVADIDPTGFVPPDDIEALAQGIQWMLALPPEVRRERGQTYRKTAQTHFDIRQVMPQWYHVYQQCRTTAYC